MNPVQKIKNRHPFDKGWITLAEVEPPNAGRRYDAISIAIWGSMGHCIHGFEVKSARSDWLRELADPKKSDTLMRYCTHWWLVCPKSVLQSLDEVPDTWGVLFETDEGLRIGRKAPHLKNPAPDAAFWRCMLLRQATRLSMPQEVQSEIDAARKSEREACQSNLSRDAAIAQSELRNLRETVDAFEKATGIHLNRFNVQSEIAQIAFLRNLNVQKLSKDVDASKQSLSNLINNLTRHLTEMTTMSEKLKGTDNASCG